MQVNDLVKVKDEGETHGGLAGIVLESKGDMSLVKLDLVAEPQGFADADLIFLGR